MDITGFKTGCRLGLTLCARRYIDFGEHEGGNASSSAADFFGAGRGAATLLCDLRRLNEIWLVHK